MAIKEYAIKVGAVYQHYKGNRYQVLAIARNESDLDKGINDNLQVVYQALYNTPNLGKNPVFIRPLPQFIEEIMTPENVRRPRFVQLEDPQ